MRDFGDMARKQFKSVAEHLAPRAMAPVLCALSGIAPDTPVHQISRGMRARLLDALKHFPVHISGFHPIEEAIITRGGVAVSDIRPKDMMSKRTEGLFFAGEMIDVDGYTGGFNLQIAFSTGHLAGASAAQYVLDDTEASAL